MIRLVSDAAIRQRFLNDAPPQIARFYYLADKPSVILDIEYVDYTVAHNMVSIVENWLKAVPKNEYATHIRFLQKNSHHFDTIARTIANIVICIILINRLENFLREHSLVRLGQYLIFSGFLFVVSRHLISESARSAESAIDSWSPVSYIILNKADNILIKILEKSNNKSMLSLAFHLAATLANAVMVKIIVEMIIKYWK